MWLVIKTWKLQWFVLVVVYCYFWSVYWLLISASFVWGHVWVVCKVQVVVDIGTFRGSCSELVYQLVPVVVCSLCCKWHIQPSPSRFLIAFRNVIPDFTILGRSFVFNQSCVHVSARLPNINSLAVSTFDTVHNCLSVARLVFVLVVGQYTSFTSP